MPDQPLPDGWIPADIPPDERARLAALHELGILDTPNEGYFDRLTALACKLFDMPMAVISLVDSDRQWFKAACGINETGHSRDWSFCAHMVADRTPLMVVEDALQDDRFFRNPLVIRPNGIRFYAGCLLRSKGGYALGSFCILDQVPRQLSEREKLQFQALGEVVEAEIQAYGNARQQQSDLAQALLYDSLTGLPNKRLLCERLDAYADLAAGEVVPFRLAVVNPLRFRAINQTLGRDAADELLRQLALRLDRAVPEGSTLARLNDDRFAILMPGTLDDDGGLDAITEALQAPFILGNAERRLDFSVGIAAYGSDRPSPEALIDRAQLALRSLETHTGTAIAAFSDDQEKQIARHFAIENRLREAIGTDAFRMVYQPIVRLQDGAMVGVEALVRWGEGDTAISPAEFIPVAEETGLIHPLSQWILATACTEFASSAEAVPVIAIVRQHWQPGTSGPGLFRPGPPHPAERRSACSRAAAGGH